MSSRWTIRIVSIPISMDFRWTDRCMSMLRSICFGWTSRFISIPGSMGFRWTRRLMEIFRTIGLWWTGRLRAIDFWWTGRLATCGLWCRFYLLMHNFHGLRSLGTNWSLNVEHFSFVVFCVHCLCPTVSPYSVSRGAASSLATKSSNFARLGVASGNMFSVDKSSPAVLMVWTTRLESEKMSNCWTVRFLFEIDVDETSGFLRED